MNQYIQALLCSRIHTDPVITIITTTTTIINKNVKHCWGQSLHTSIYVGNLQNGHIAKIYE